MVYTLFYKLSQKYTCLFPFFSVNMNYGVYG
jgi:hypothetical protein